MNSYGCQVDAAGYWVVNAYSIEIAMYLSSNSYDCHVDADRYWVVNAYSIEIAMKWKNISEHDWAMKCWIGCFEAIIFSPLAYYNYCCCIATASSEKFMRSLFLAWPIEKIKVGYMTKTFWVACTISGLAYGEYHIGAYVHIEV